MPQASHSPRVLSTLNEDGSRRWIRPKPSAGRFLNRRRAVGYFLIALFVTLPHLRINQKPPILINIVDREFTFFGSTFYATDTLLLLFFLLMVFTGIFFLTAVFGRAWCGWGCPQTVYLELLFRPLERLIEGGYHRQKRLDRDGMDWRRALKYPIFFLLSMLVAHTFLAYFVGTDQLAQWVRQSPLEHPFSFLVMAAVTCAMFFDFTYFREQTCIVACPYGRFQSVLLDRQSLIVGYDSKRGEPRGRQKGSEVATVASGDCIDCKLCVTTCPTGIDIRDGLQMECVGCTQCIDACDAVMEKIGKPRGLIRYSSQDQLSGKKFSFWRPRVVIYPTLFLLLATGLTLTVQSKTAFEVVGLTRSPGTVYNVLPSGELTNSLNLKIQNRSDEQRSYELKILGIQGARIQSAELPLVIPAGKLKVASFFAILPEEIFTVSDIYVDFEIKDDLGNTQVEHFPFLGRIHRPNRK